MHRPARVIASHVSWALLGFFCLGIASVAQAATTTDIFPLSVTGKEWCRNDPKFFETIHVSFKKGNTLTVIRDPLNNGDLTDIQATVNTNGGNATIDAITMNGEALLANKSGSTAELVLSGTDPGNSAHYLILRGKATFDKTGKLTKVTGTFVFQILDTVNGVPNIDCFGSGTFVTQKLSSGGASGGGGTLTVANAPASVGGKFVANKRAAAEVSGGIAAVAWAEVNLGTLGHVEVITVGFDATTGQVVEVIFSIADGSVGTAWGCSGFLPSGCAGASVSRTAGTFTVVNTVLTDTTDSSPPQRLH